MNLNRILILLVICVSCNAQDQCNWSDEKMTDTVQYYLSRINDTSIYYQSEVQDYYDYAIRRTEERDSLFRVNEGLQLIVNSYANNNFVFSDSLIYLEFNDSISKSFELNYRSWDNYYTNHTRNGQTLRIEPDTIGFKITTFNE